MEWKYYFIILCCAIAILAGGFMMGYVVKIYLYEKKERQQDRDRINWMHREQKKINRKYDK